MSQEIISLSVAGGSSMNAVVMRPANAIKGGLILFQEAYGVNNVIQGIAQRFADEGYVVIAPEIFHRTAEPGLTIEYSNFDGAKPHYGAITSEGIEADARACFDWLVAQSGVNRERIFATGFCLGGRATFIANSVLPLRAAAAFYGGGSAALAPTIASKQHGKILFLWGGKDGHIPATDRQVVADAMDAAGKPYINVVFSEAGHAFFRNVGEYYHAPSAAIAWEMVKALFNENE